MGLDTHVVVHVFGKVALLLEAFPAHFTQDAPLPRVDVHMELEGEGTREDLPADVADERLPRFLVKFFMFIQPHLRNKALPTNLALVFSAAFMARLEVIIQITTRNISLGAFWTCKRPEPGVYFPVVGESAPVPEAFIA